MKAFKKIVDELLIKSVEEIMLQTGMGKYDILTLARKCGYEICVGVSLEKKYKKEIIFGNQFGNQNLWGGILWYLTKNELYSIFNTRRR